MSRAATSTINRQGAGIAAVKASTPVIVSTAVVVDIALGYFGYQWWFNPSRAVKRQLGEVAAALSVPPARATWPGSRGWRSSVAIWLTTFGSAPETPSSSRDAILAL